MTKRQWQTNVARIALGVGLVLFIIALRYTDWNPILAGGWRFLLALLAALVLSGAWHLVRTIAWAWCFSSPDRVSFARLFRVRIAAEAFSYMTLRGIAGEPLKVVLLASDVEAREAAAAVALERLAYLLGTTVIVGIGSAVALTFVPLSPVWTQIFRAFAVGTVVVVVVAMIIRQRRRAIFDSRRLTVLTLSAVAAYAFMSLEAWASLRILGINISITDALAIETFSRVASFASAVIPANLGALEASSLAIVAAVGSSGGGALGLIRRLRGLFWAAIGFLVYPRHRSVPARVEDVVAIANAAPSASTLVYVAHDEWSAVTPVDRLARLAIGERVLRAASQAGYRHVIAFDPGNRLARIAGRLDITVRIVNDDETWRTVVDETREEAVTVIGPGTVVSAALLRAAALVNSQDNPVVDVPAGPAWPVSGLIRVHLPVARDLAELRRAFLTRSQRDRSLPSGQDVSHGRGMFAIQARSIDELRTAEETFRLATFKSTDAKVARFNRRMSLPISMALLPMPITANQISIALIAIGVWAAWLFSRGHYVAGVAGGLLSLSASILDGCDGEVARLKYQESALGCWIETFGDYTYYLAIFTGLTVGAVRQTNMPVFYWIGAMGLAGTVTTFAMLVYLRSRMTGRPEAFHAVAKSRIKADRAWSTRLVWRLSFVATRAAMPYGIFALALLNLLPLVVVLAAIGANVYWLSLASKWRHLVGDTQAEAAAA